MSKPIPLFIFGKENNVDAVYLYQTNTNSKPITFDWYPYGPDSKDNTEIKGTFKKFEKVKSQTGGAPADEEGAVGPPEGQAPEGESAKPESPAEEAQDAPEVPGQTPGLDAAPTAEGPAPEQAPEQPEEGADPAPGQGADEDPAVVSEAEPIIYGNKFTYTKSSDKWTLEYKKVEEDITYKLLCDNNELFYYVIQKGQPELRSKFIYTDLKFDNFK